MDRDAILAASRREHGNRDLVERETAVKAGAAAGRIGATVCLLLTLLFHRLMGTFLLSPWVIYFSILTTHALVRYVGLRRKTDLLLTGLFGGIGLLVLALWLLRLREVTG